MILILGIDVLLQPYCIGYGAISTAICLLQLFQLYVGAISEYYYKVRDCLTGKRMFLTYTDHT